MYSTHKFRYDFYRMLLWYRLYSFLPTIFVSKNIYNFVFFFQKRNKIKERLVDKKKIVDRYHLTFVRKFILRV